MSWQFLLTSLIVVATPGTGVIVTLAAALAHGRRASVVAALGCTLGIVPHMLAAMTGLAALLHASALAYEAIRYAGVAYLLYMAVMIAREDGALAVDTATAPRSDRQTIVSAIMVNLLNPKLSIFFLAFMPQFIAADAEGAVLHMAELSLVFMAITFAVFVLYSLCAASVRDRILSRPAVMTGLRRGFAAAFVGLGIKLATADR
ncbi:LysE family translocator [Rhizobium sp. CSW-27]|uniref:LysE family translocator n=1 Tax=Rhizobium sp. CSW-27 TaxID=2839985 RepID=UPI001C034DF7|nr:LysE family translocator [Rhizobium sp. CSW-27]MBT9371900.1 LysE family translocator [Rhizobium sp. CSW-27]